MLFNVGAHLWKWKYVEMDGGWEVGSRVGGGNQRGGGGRRGKGNGKEITSPWPNMYSP
jgi:hypothetical protein